MDVPGVPLEGQLAAALESCGRSGQPSVESETFFALSLLDGSDGLGFRCFFVPGASSIRGADRLLRNHTTGPDGPKTVSTRV